MSLTVLLVEPDHKLRDEVRAALKAADHTVWTFAGAEAARAGLAGGEPDLALLASTDDPALDGLVTGIRAAAPRCQVVWIAPAGGGEVEALAAERSPRGLLSRAGLADRAVGLAGRIAERRARSEALRSAPDMLGTSVAMETVRDLLDRVAGGGAPTVLITGESGTGKEVAAQRLHARGPRAEGPFVEVDCASIPAELMEGTLFGHEPGAFTDARETRIGLLELGQGGTVFLDEIGELEAGLQAKLLRVLDSRRFRRLGGSEEIELDVHLVAATNRDLAAEVEAGAFRADLFYRLDVVRVELPPLRDRGEDVLLLARRFLGEAARRLGKEARGFAPAVEEDLLRHRWPGNVRELRNHMERLALAVDPAAGRVEDAGLEVRPPREEDRIHVDFSAGPVRFETIERHVLTEALRAAEGNVSEAARLLGLGRGALRYRLQRLETEGESPAADEAA